MGAAGTDVPGAGQVPEWLPLAEGCARRGLTAVPGPTAGAAVVVPGVTGFGLTAGRGWPVWPRPAGLGADDVAEGCAEPVAWTVAVPGAVLRRAAG